jgi:hypothetical protein
VGFSLAADVLCSIVISVDFMTFKRETFGVIGSCLLVCSAALAMPFANSLAVVDTKGPMWTERDKSF